MEREEDLVRRVRVVDEEEVMNINKRRLAILKQGIPPSLFIELYLKRLKREQ